MNDQISILFAREASQLLEQNKIGEAKKICEAGVKQIPLYTEGHFVLARCYDLNNQPEDAVGEYERVLNFMPGHIGALNALARYHYHKEMYHVGDQFKLSVFLYHAYDEELVRYLTGEELLPLSPEEEAPLAETPIETVDEAPIVAEDTTLVGVNGVDLAPVVSPDQLLEEEFQTIISDESAIDDLWGETAPEPVDTESLFESPEMDNLITDADSGRPDETELLQEEGFTISKPFSVDTPPPEMELPDRPLIEDSLFLEPEEPPSAPAKTPEEADNVDLSRYANTRDDFSTLMNDMFVPGQEQEQEQEQEREDESPQREEPATEEEAAQMAEEPPMLDTSIIFLEKKKEDIPAKDKDADLEDDSEIIPTVQDDNSLAADITHIPSQGLNDNFPVGGPASNDRTTSDNLNEVIERIESNDRTAQVSDNGNQEPQVLDGAAVFEMNNTADDNSVNIEDILSNPSLLTPTFGEILIAQKKFENARHVFRELLKKEPQNPRFLKKVEFLDKLVTMNK